MASPQEITRLLKEWADGTQSALEALTPLVYGELRRLAASYVEASRPDICCSPTALVHETFVRLAGRAPDCENPSQFYDVAAHPMRQILIDHARTRQAVKRESRIEHLRLDEELVVSHERDADLAAPDEALERLAAIDERKVRVVEMRFFGGLSVQESAEVLNVSEVTVRGDWQFAKTWLLRELSGEKGDGT